VPSKQSGKCPTAFPRVAPRLIQQRNSRAVSDDSDSTSAFVTTGAATLVDIYDSVERGEKIGVFLAAPLLGTSLGPLLGGPLAQAFSWRAALWMLAAFIGIDLCLFVFFFRDTFRCERSLAYRRALARRGCTVNGPCQPPDPVSLGTTIESKEKAGLGDGPTSPLFGDSMTGDVLQKITPSLADVNPLPPVLSILQRRNNIPTLISSGTTHFPFFTLRFPTHSLALQLSSLPLVTPSRSRAPERSPTRHTTTTRSKSGSSSSPSAPGAYLAACSGDAGLTGSCVG
jgi:MFS family permease